MISDALRSKISILSQLANIDGEFDTRELAFIYGVCIRNKIEVDQIADLISAPAPVISIDKLSAEERVAYLTDILLLMMIDGKVLLKEIDFCLDIAVRLGFDTNATRAFIDELSAYTDGTEEFVKQKVLTLLRADQ